MWVDRGGKSGFVIDENHSFVTGLISLAGENTKKYGVIKLILNVCCNKLK
jgi:hypothetical protein